MRDDNAFAALYASYAPSVFRRARHMLGNEADANEVVQDLFLTMLEKPEQYQSRSALMTFLYSATTHACLNRIRNRKNRERLHGEHFGLASPFALGLTQEQVAILHRAIDALPDDVCQALIYSVVDGMTHQEIADIVLCSRRHVGDLLARATTWISQNEVPE